MQNIVLIWELPCAAVNVVLGVGSYGRLCYLVKQTNLVKMIMCTIILGEIKILYCIVQISFIFSILSHVIFKRQKRSYFNIQSKCIISTQYQDRD